MAKTWVLDTETKGTGAHVVPLEDVLQRRGPEPELSLVALGRAPKRKPDPEQQPPVTRRFKVVDLTTRETLAEDADTATTIDVLRRVRSIVDVHIYAWNPTRDRWRLITLDEQRALWDFREAQPDPTRAA